MKKHAMDRLQLRIDEMENPTCLGIDPSPEVVPDFLFQKGKELYKKDINCALEYAIYEFGRRLINSTADIVPAVKPQLAFYESYGTAGMKALEKTMLYAQDRGMLVVADAKRGDIGSTCEAYARAFLGETTIADLKFRAFPADIITVQPYTGWDGIKPFLDAVCEYKAGIFLLCRTSNPSAKDLQDLELSDGRAVVQILAELITKWGQSSVSEKYILSALGAVVAATYPEEARRLRAIMPHTFFLVPGYGAQGAGAADAVAGFRADGSGAIVSASRSIATAYKKFDYPPEKFEQAARAETIEMREKLNKALNHRQTKEEKWQV